MDYRIFVIFFTLFFRIIILIVQFDIFSYYFFLLCYVFTGNVKISVHFKQA